MRQERAEAATAGNGQWVEGGRIRGTYDRRCDRDKKHYPGIITGFLWKAWERTPRGLPFQSITGRYSCQMSAADFFSDLSIAISADRFGPYFSGNPHSQLEAYGTYALNMALCESLYPALNCLEISLRNSIHAAAVREFGVADWFQGRLHANEIEPMNKLHRDLQSRGKSAGINDLNQSQCGMYILRTAIRSQGSRLDRRGGFQTRPYQWTARAPASPPAMKRYLA